MARIESAECQDGSSVQFIYDDSKSGSVKDVYFHPDKHYAVAFFRNNPGSTGQERLEKIVDVYRNKLFESESSEYWKTLFRWPDRIVDFKGKTGIVMPHYESHFFFPPGYAISGAEKKNSWYTSTKVFNKSLPEPEKGNLMGFLTVCVHLSRAVKKLHAMGLAHSDLSGNNCLVDPLSGAACIIDIDGLVVPNVYPPDVIGTKDFIPPEVIMTQHLSIDNPNRVLPSRTTDLHALAVLIYTNIFHRHPLRGSKVWDTDDDKQELLETGEKALFIEHPTDKTNRFKIEKSDSVLLPWVDTNKLPYTLSGPYLTSLFNRAFIQGLHSPDKRPLADEWEMALLKTRDLLLPCPNNKCVKKFFIYDASKSPVCPYCGTKIKNKIPVIDFKSFGKNNLILDEKYKLVIYNGLRLYKWHVYKNVYLNEKLKQEDRKPLGTFFFHNNQWMFLNSELTTLRNMTTDAFIPINSTVVLTPGLKLRFSDTDQSRAAFFSF